MPGSLSAGTDPAHRPWVLGVPFWVFAGLLALMALGMFWLQKKLERRMAGEEKS